jgi:hypothetical protein
MAKRAQAGGEPIFSGKRGSFSSFGTYPSPSYGGGRSNSLSDFNPQCMSYINPI